ncbi:hypothetical protein DdX_14298 [Ditylenchus destructor]|uniref:Uncharacterized protein n=1 Tax=Ditylenchus destructor TaxID=166010 RepID=A0AAD4MXE6_9BILA|nr:hypothetical protein DdX_14298 [Ditylenchus destructor]
MTGNLFVFVSAPFDVHDLVRFPAILILHASQHLTETTCATHSHQKCDPRVLFSAQKETLVTCKDHTRTIPEFNACYLYSDTNVAIFPLLDTAKELSTIFALAKH